VVLANYMADILAFLIDDRSGWDREWYGVIFMVEGEEK